MNCAVGERWALNQMQEINSPLSKQGRAICSKIEALTSIPTYYYLDNYNKFKNDRLSRPCPGCNKKWGLKTALRNRYDFKCDKCRIVSDLSPLAR
jgi:predicted  nucleic acid-binding Zn ribbon protein